MTFNRFAARISNVFGELRNEGRMIAAVQASAWTRTPMSSIGDPVGPHTLRSLRNRKEEK